MIFDGINIRTPEQAAYVVPGLADLVAVRDTTGPDRKKLPNLPGGGGGKKAGPKRIKKALKALKKTNALDGGRIGVPYPLAKSDEFQLNTDKLEGAKREDVPLKNIIAVEPSVKRKRVKKYIKQGGDFSPIPTLLCVKTKGADKYYISNGHHRCTAAWYLQLDSVTANVIDTNK